MWLLTGECLHSRAVGDAKWSREVTGLDFRGTVTGWSNRVMRRSPVMFSRGKHQPCPGVAAEAAL